MLFSSVNSLTIFKIKRLRLIYVHVKTEQLLYATARIEKVFHQYDGVDDLQVDDKVKCINYCTAHIYTYFLSKL